MTVMRDVQAQCDRAVARQAYAAGRPAWWKWHANRDWRAVLSREDLDRDEDTFVFACPIDFKPAKVPTGFETVDPFQGQAPQPCDRNVARCVLACGHPVWWQTLTSDHAWQRVVGSDVSLDGFPASAAFATLAKVDLAACVAADAMRRDVEAIGGVCVMGPPSAHEVRTARPKRRWSLAPMHAIGAVVDVMTQGASKHDDLTYLLGGVGGTRDAIDLDAAMRHVEAHFDGLEADAESGCHPLAHAAARLLMIVERAERAKAGK